MKNMFLSRKEKKKEEAAPQGGGISRALGKVSFEGFDWWLFTLMLIILAIGLIMVLSASGIVAEQVNGVGSWGGRAGRAAGVAYDSAIGDGEG